MNLAHFYNYFNFTFNSSRSAFGDSNPKKRLKVVRSSFEKSPTNEKPVIGKYILSRCRTVGVKLS